MKLSRVLSVFAIVAVFSLASCKKDDCYVCTLQGSDSTETLCEDDYSVLGFSAFDEILEEYTDDGYVCTKQ